MGNVESAAFAKGSTSCSGCDKPASFVAAAILKRALNTPGTAWQNGPDVSLPGDVCCSQVHLYTHIVAFAMLLESH
jgi:hypothetical protein